MSALAFYKTGPPALNLDLKSGALLGESQECLPVEIQKSISDDPRSFISQRSASGWAQQAIPLPGWYQQPYGRLLTRPTTIVEGMHCMPVKSNGDPPSQLIERGEEGDNSSEEGESD